MQLALDLLAYQAELQLTQHEGNRYVWDSIRKKKVRLTKEELLRQLVIAYLQGALGCPKTHIAVEREFKVLHLQKRFDVIVYTPAMEIWLLVECKSPTVPITDAAFRQIATYNRHFQAQYLLVTNGIASYACAMQYALHTYALLAALPPYPIAPI